MERQIYRILSREKQQTQRTIQRLFNVYLNKAPSFDIKSKEKAHLLIDGTYFHNNLCLVLYYDSDIKYVQLHRLTDRERYEEVKEDLFNLEHLGVQIESVTCDGHKAVLKAIREVYPNVIIQRCLVHIQRMSRLWLTSRAKTDCARQLLALSQQLTSISTVEEKYYWMLAIHYWEKQYKSFINEKTINPLTGKYWYKHKMIRRVRHLIYHAWHNLFHYLDNSQIPKSTNAIESYFGHLKNHLNVHRGLTLEHRIAFIKWYLHFNNNKE